MLVAVLLPVVVLLLGLVMLGALARASSDHFRSERTSEQLARLGAHRGFRTWSHAFVSATCLVSAWLWYGRYPTWWLWAMAAAVFATAAIWTWRGRRNTSSGTNIQGSEQGRRFSALRLAVTGGVLLLAARITDGFIGKPAAAAEVVVYGTLVGVAMLLLIAAGVIAFKDAMDRATDEYRKER